MTPCPRHEQLSDYILGACGSEEAEHIERHLESCERCTEWCLAEDRDDRMLSDVREVLESEACVGASGSEPDAEPQQADAADGEIVQGFRIERELGRGGMGAVYLAEQLSTKRTVALKVLIDGPFANEDARRRFEREVELAAQLDHPNIVTVLESGSSNGRQYFAMKYVDGLELDDYVRTNELTKRQVLALFAALGRAVSYAHQRGVMHRDLKPSNVIVNEAGEPFVLDFGLAKASGLEAQRGRDDRLLSEPGRPIGTLPYMSPEQTSGMQHELDIRSDVYSLGLIAFRLLTGQHPYAVTGEVYEVLRNIKEADPARPSALRADLDDDIDTILLKALSKDRERRYQSVDALVDDVERYLAGLPITAKRDSTAYVLGKLVSRHRLLVTASAIVLLLAATAAFSTIRARNAAIRAETSAILTALVEDPSEATARIERAPAAVRQATRQAIGRSASSGAFTDRVVAGRGGLLLNERAFWQSVDGGALWSSGEWLELCDAAELATPRVKSGLRRLAQTGTSKQRYVALCLLGCLADTADQESAAIAAAIAASDPHPGPAMAAEWAAHRYGRAAQRHPQRTLFDDELTGMVFSRVPGTAAFQRGSDKSDRYRFDDEEMPAAPVAIEAFYLATTEVPISLARRFFEAAEIDREYAAGWGTWADARGQSAAMQEEQNLPAGMITLNAARQMCVWLNAQAADATPSRTYRLPTENEWEYAARGGSNRRYCYGDDPKYADMFAQCRGVQSWPVAAQRMPNWYGLFDAHGSLWEWTSSIYPENLAVAAGVERGEYFVYRGGAFHSPAVRCRSAQRNFGSENRANDYMGVRLVLEMSED